MKKKLFIFIAMLAVLACLFAVTAFAAEPDTTRETFTLSDNTVLPIWDKDGNGLIWYISQTETVDNGDGTTTTTNTYSYVPITQTDSATKPYVAYGYGGPYDRAVDGKRYKGYQINSVTITDDNGTYSSHEAKIVLANLQGLMFSDGTNKVNMFASTFKDSKALEAVYLDAGSAELPVFILTESFLKCVKLRHINMESCHIIEIGGNGVFSSCSSLAEINLPNTVKVIGSYPFQKTAITEFTFPDSVVSVTGNAHFNECKSLQKVYGYKRLFEDGVLTSIPSNMFKSCSKLEVDIDTFVFDGITSIGSSAFNGCSSIYGTIDIPATVTSIDSDAWRGCSKITGVTFHPDCSIENVWAHTFNGTKITTVQFPNTVKQMKESVFNSCSSLESVNFGASFVDFNLSGCAQPAFSLSNTLKYLYMPSTFTADAIRDDIFSWNDNNANEYNKYFVNLTMFYTGTQAQAEAIVAKGATGGTDGAPLNTYFGTMTVISIDDYNAKVANGTLEVGVSGSPKRYIVYGCNPCELFYYNNHTLTGTDCTQDDACTICTLAIEGQEAHTLVETLTYVSFLENGVYLCDCTFNGCTAVDVVAEDEASVADPIFGAGDGFSTKGTDGISGGYVVDVEALNEYNRVNKDAKITFGIMVINPNYLAGKDSFLDSAGKVNTTGGALQVDMSATQYQNVSVSITGFTGNVADISLVIALYAYTDAGEVEYIQSQTTKCASANVTLGTQKLYTVTLASVTAGTSTVDGLGDYVMPSTNDDEEQA